MNNKTVVTIFVLAILALSSIAMIQILPVKAVGSCTLSDTYLMSADFKYMWNGPPGTFVTKTDISGPGVRFNFTDLGKVGMGDNYPVAQGAGGAPYDGHYSDFSGYWGYSVLFVNLGPDPISVHLFMNTGFTSSPHTAAEDTFWASNWTSLAVDESAIVTLDFSSCGQAYNIADDPVLEWQHLEGTGGWPVRRLQEVTGIGFEVIDSGSASASVIVSGDLAHLYIDPPVVNKAPGDPDFTVAVTLSNFANLYGFDIKLTWDNTLITFVSADKTPLDTLWPAIPPETSGWTVILETSGAGFYKLAVSSIGAVASNVGASVLFRVTFHIAKSCNFPLSTPIHFDVVKLSDNGTPTPNPIPATVTDGMYYISATIPDLEIVVVPAPGGHGPPFEYCDNFELEVWVTHICPDSPLKDYTIVIQFGTHLARFVDVDRWNTTFGIGTGGETPPGTITVTCNGGPGSGGRFFLFALTFHVEFAFEEAHIWKKGLPNYETFDIKIDDATLSFDQGYIYKTGIAMPEPVTIQVNFIRGDVNCDGKVTIEDISSAAWYYDYKEGGTDWDTAKKYDLNNDKIVDIFDIVTISTNYGYGVTGH